MTPWHGGGMKMMRCVLCKQPFSSSKDTDMLMKLFIRCQLACKSQVFACKCVGFF